ncbi:MAG TPA: NfeD family protein [Solirubrobacteraceae bacterium]|jgi:membrane-bound ClpP family serine protease|nr:NfeD family protein [Solirubrobacteraceae bacterium]
MVIIGIALLVLGAALMVAEAHLPTYGVLGLAGAIGMVGGAALAVDASGGGTALVVAVALVVAAVAATLLVLALRATLSVTGRRARTGVEALIGHVGVVRSAPAPLGQVLVDGALWQARPCMGDELHAGDHVVVERVSGLTLSVRRAEEWELEP